MTSSKQHPSDADDSELDSADEPALEPEKLGSRVSSAKDSPSFGTRFIGFFRDRYFSLDPRWLGVWRILIACLIIVDLLRRWADARAFYTNEGLLPNHFSLFAPMGRHVFSIYHAFSSFGEVSVAFSIALVCYLCLLVGYRTRLFHILSTFFVLSLNARNLFVENGGTVVVNLIMIWTAFLPVGRRFSVDSVLYSLRVRKETGAGQLNDRADPVVDVRPVVSIVVPAMLLQWSFIYFFNTVHKTGSGWHDGTALHWFWHQDRIVTWLAILMRENAPIWVSKFLAYGTLVVEGSLAAMILMPFGRKWFRRVCLLFVVLLHGGIASMSRLGPFSYVMISFFVLILGAEDWTLIARWFGREKRARTVIYDADCGICLLLCRVAKRLDPFERLTFVENTDLEKIPEAVPRDLLDESVVVLLPDGSYVVEERAAFEVLRALPLGILLGGWLRVPGLAIIGRALYRKIALKRLEISVWFGLGACGVPGAAGPEPEIDGDADPYDRLSSPLGRRMKRLGRLAVEGLAMVYIYCFIVQVSVNNPWVRRHAVVLPQPGWAQTTNDYLRAYQGWGMFAPQPPFDDGRVVVDARTADGRQLDPLTGRVPDFSVFAPNGWGHDQLWCDYHNKIRFGGNGGHRKHFKEYLLKYPNRTGRKEDRLVAFDVWWVGDKSPPPGHQEPRPLVPRKLVSHNRVTDSLAKAAIAKARASKPVSGER